MLGNRVMRRRSVVAWASVVLAACADPSATSGESTGEGSTGTTVVTTGADTGVDTTASTTGVDGTTTGVNGLPPVPLLVSPADGAVDVPLETELCWEPVVDPDGDPVRYRVFLDDTELTEGRLGDGEGYEGPCLGPLTFAYEQSYTWQVQAFEADDPSRSSDKSEAWAFTVASDGDTHVVFEDHFDVDLGWEITGDAATGAWVRGDPATASLGGELSQPGQCIGGTSCYFTGQNAGMVADDEDVSGGSTVLTSPPFDLGEAATATVELRRFFFKSEAEVGPQLTVELLVPDAGRPGGYVAHPLEQLGEATADAPENLWTPREYAACGLPMADGTRLRITAHDDGTGILEAAIDTVIVRAHDFTTVCDGAEGGICDPQAGATACPEDLLCCAQGTINAGVYRCGAAAAGLDFASPPPDPRSPGNGPLGCDAPDLTIDPSYIEPVLTDIMVSDDSCLLLEGCAGATGTRTILRFSLATPNVGSRDLVLGVAANNPDVFHFSDCHGHYHFDEYASYELRDADGVVASGHKQAFCLLDFYSWAWPNEQGTYTCANQGISRGFGDIYDADLPCQWIDVTGVPPGDYTLRVALNQPRPDWALPLLVERDYENNVIDVPVTLP